MSAERIESPKNPRVRAARALKERKGRRAAGSFLLEGRRELPRALAAGVRPEVAFHCPERLDDADRALLRELSEAGAELVEVGPRALGALAYRDPPETGVVVVAPLPDASLGAFSPRQEGPLLVVEGCEKPGNLGALLRSADGAGAAGVLACGEGVDLGNPNLIRASLGTLFALPVAAGSAEEARAWLAGHGYRVLATSPDASRDYWDLDLATPPVALVLGSEARGLGGVWLDGAAETLRLPMRGVADSLNLAQSGSILLYEALRQRTAGARGGAA